MDIRIPEPLARQLFDALKDQLGPRPTEPDAKGASTMPFGKFKSMTFDEIAKSDDGCRYLDWLAGKDDLREPLKSKLTTFVSTPEMQKAIESALDTKTPF